MFFILKHILFLNTIIRWYFFLDMTANGRWHLFHPGWTLKAIKGRTKEDEINLEDSVQALHSIRRHERNVGTTEKTLNEFWFCTKPEYFVTRCLPKDPNNQLLSARSPMDKNEFFAIPDLRQSFFTQGFKLIRHNTCVINTKDGVCSISLKVPKHEASRCRFEYELSFVEEEKATQEAVDIMKATPDKYVAHEIRKSTLHTFNIRCHWKGNYFFKIKKFEPQIQAMVKCCEFKIHCSEPMKKFRPFVPSNGIGFGIGPQALKYGIKPKDESKDRGTVVTKAKEMRPVQTLTLAEDWESGSDADDSEWERGSDAMDFDYEADLLGSDFDGKITIIDSKLYCIYERLYTLLIYLCVISS